MTKRTVYELREKIKEMNKKAYTMKTEYSNQIDIKGGRRDSTHTRIRVPVPELLAAFPSRRNSNWSTRYGRAGEMTKNGGEPVLS